MKKLSIPALLLICLIAVLLLRSHTHFPDRQLYGATPVPALPVDAGAVAERLSGALRIPTISYDDRSNFDSEAFLDFHRYLEAHFPQVHRTATRRTVNRYSLVYRIEGLQPELKPVLFMGHMDVVPVDPATAGQWRHAPFSGTIADGVIWGRGALDDKLTVLALMEAMERRLADGQKPARTVYLAFGHDEEVGGKDGAREIARYFESQGIEFEFVLDEGGVVTRGMVPGVDQPVAIIGIAEKGYVNLHLTVDAPGGHSSQPPPHTAAGILAAAIVRVEDNPFPTDLSAMAPNFDYLGHYFALPTRVALANTWLFSPLVERRLLANPTTAASIRTTTAVTMLEGSSKSNILPTRAEAVVNFRILPGDSVASVKQHVESVINDERVAVTAQMANEPSPVSSTESFGFRLLEKTIRGTSEDILVAPYLVQGGTDAKHFVNLSDSVYRFMMIPVDPTTMQRVHGVNEQVAIDDYVEAVRFYHALLGNLDDGDG
jgi:carboxypeptidase PM20D1